MSVRFGLEDQVWSYVSPAAKCLDTWLCPQVYLPCVGSVLHLTKMCSRVSRALHRKLAGFTPLYALPSYPACLTAAEHLAASSCHGRSSCSAFAGCCLLPGGCFCSEAYASVALLDIADDVPANGLHFFPVSRLGATPLTLGSRSSVRVIFKSFHHV